MNNSSGPALGILGIVLTIASFFLGGTKREDSKWLLRIGLGLIVAGLVIGNGLLNN